MTYENFIVPNIYLEYVLGQHRVSFINEYYKKHKNYPSDKTLQGVVLTDEEKEKYKRIFYAQYKTTGITPSEPNTPQEPETPIIPPVSDEDETPIIPEINLIEQNWLELPSMNNSDLEYISHSFEMNNEMFRNYSFGFSKKDKLSHWVAYPLNKMYLQGEYNYTEAWQYDPIVPLEYSPAPFQSYRGFYVRGHMVPPADRQCCYESNAQCFYGTNIIPQDSFHNERINVYHERKVRDIASNSDECYVIVGVLTKDSTKITYDSVGKTVTVPTHIYRIALSYLSNSDKWSVFCVLTENRGYTIEEANQCYYTIKELEDITDIEFFTNLKKRVGEEKYNEIKNQASERP